MSNTGDYHREGTREIDSKNIRRRPQMIKQRNSDTTFIKLDEFCRTQPHSLGRGKTIDTSP